MFKFIIPTLSVALLCNSIATAQYFGNQYPASSGFQQPKRPVRIARATDNEPLSSASNKLDDLDSLDALDAPALNEIPPPATKPLDSIITLDQPQPLDAPTGHKPLAFADMPERLGLPGPAEIDKAARPEQSRNSQPEISANDFDTIEPIAPMQSILQPSFAQYYGGTHWTGHRAANAGCQGEPAGDCGSGQGSLPYRTPILPPPSSFYGYFRSNPCYFDLWATYPAEAAAACEHNRRKLAPTGPGGCPTCEWVAPCPH